MAQQPDYNISVKRKSDGRTGRIGGAWVNDGGRISIQLHPGCTIDSNPDHQYSLFLRDSNYRDPIPPPAGKYPNGLPGTRPEPEDDDIPF